MVEKVERRNKLKRSMDFVRNDTAKNVWDD